MKKLFLLPLCLLVLTACETTSEESASPFQAALARQNTEKQAILKAKMTQLPLVKEGDEAQHLPKIVKLEKATLSPASDKAEIEKPRIIKPALEAQTHKKQTPEKPRLSPEALKGNAQRLDMMPIGAISKNENALILRFPAQKDELTPFEEARIKAFFLQNPSLKGVKLTVGGDGLRQGYDMLKGVNDRIRAVKQFIPSEQLKSEIYAPEQENNTAKIEFF